MALPLMTPLRTRKQQTVHMAPVPQEGELTIQVLQDLVDPKNPALLEKLGGAEGLAEKLGRFSCRSLCYSI